MPRQQPFPSDLESFIARCIDSVEQVEILLLVREQPERRWTIDEISRHLRSTPHSVALRLAQLQDRGLVSRSGDDSFSYSARSHVDALVERLADAYRERRTSVIERIFSQRDAIQSFADAFRLRPDPDEDD